MVLSSNGSVWHSVNLPGKYTYCAVDEMKLTNYSHDCIEFLLQKRTCMPGPVSKPTAKNGIGPKGKPIIFFY